MGAKSGVAYWVVMVFLNIAVQQGPRELHPFRFTQVADQLSMTSSETRRAVVGCARLFARMYVRPRAVLRALLR